MFDMFDLLISSHPHILRFLCSHLYPLILASSCPYVHVYVLVSSHSYILISSGSCALVCIPGFSCPQVYVCLLITLYPHILVSLGSCTHMLVGILAFLHPHLLRFMYSRCLLVSSHPHILISLGSCTLGACWYPRILTSSYPQHAFSFD